MQQKMKISIVAFAVLLLGVLTINLVMGTSSLANSQTFTAANEIPITELPDDIEALKELVPTTLEEVEARPILLRARYLMWTHDGVHIMWGFCGNGRFVGTDNRGNRGWGIYGKGVFAGFYDGEFFWGRYSNGTWKANDLFRPGETHGRYVLFPLVTPNATTESLK